MTHSEKPAPVQMSSRAAQKILALIDSKNDDTAMFRLAVLGGGCSGFQYDFSLEKTRRQDDAVITRDGATMLVDPTSLPFLKGAELDYVEEPIGSYFRVNNPNTASSCGCGSSFSIA